MSRLQMDNVAPPFIVQLADGAVHELIRRPLKSHDVGSLMQREVTWDRLHVVPLKIKQDDRCFHFMQELRKIIAQLRDCCCLVMLFKGV